MLLYYFQFLFGALLFVIPIVSVAFSVDPKVGDRLVSKHLTNLDIETLVGGEAGSKSRKSARNDEPVTSQPHLTTTRSIFDDTINVAERRAEAPSFTYCQAEEGTPQKRADDAVPSTKGCGCLPFTKMLWHGVVFGVGKTIEGLGKCLEGCCNCGLCGARVGAAEAGGGALGGGLGGGGLGAAQGQAMGAGGGAVGRRFRRTEGSSVSRRDSRLISLVPDALHHKYFAERAGPLGFTYCFASRPTKHKRANDAAAATRGCGCVPFTKMVWQGVVLGTKSLGSILGRCLSPCRSCLHGCCMAEGIQGGGAAGGVNGGAAAAAAAVSNPAAGKRRSMIVNKEIHDAIPSPLSLSARSNTPPTTPPHPQTYTYCPTEPPKKHKRATNDALPTTTTNTECNRIKTAW